ncbi:MAG: hypothetical protein JRH16_16585 [Deltaproteobacteria bacterium]|nr:hypothetical protein [Deltaproteobacteria bacterium]
MPIGPQRNGRVVYTGGTGFGGLSQMLLGGGGLVTRPGTAPHDFGSHPFWAGQEPFGGGLPTQYAVNGAAWIGTTAAVDINFLNGATYTMPKTAPTESGGIMSSQWGPQITAGSKATYCPVVDYPNILTSTCLVGTGPLKTAAPGTTTNTGFLFSAATVFAQVATGTGGDATPDWFTITGYDARTAKGIGKIVLVAGGLSLRKNQAGTNPSAGADSISMTISEKTPSMSAGGFAATAVRMVLAAGYAMRRRF